MCSLLCNTSVAALKAMAEPTRLRLLVLLARGGAQRQGPDADPRAEPAAHQPASEAAGRGGAGGAGAGGQLGLLPAGRGRPRAGRWRGSCSKPWIAPIRCSCATGGAPKRCRRSGSGRRRPISRRTPASGTASARCMWPRPRSRRPSRRRWGRGRSICWSISAPARAACSSCSRERYRRGLGIDLSPAMLAYARAKLERTELRARPGAAGRHLRSAARRPRPPMPSVMHQVLHFLSDPQRAVREAARVLAPGGRLLIVDFAPHELEFLREQYAHERLGLRRTAGRAVAGRQRPARSWGGATWRPAATSRRRQADGIGVGRRPAAERGRQRRKTWTSASWNGLPDDGRPQRATQPAARRRRHQRLLRVLPAEDGEDGGGAVGGDPAAGAAAAALRVGDLRRRRLDARAHACHRGARWCARRR